MHMAEPFGVKTVSMGTMRKLSTIKMRKDAMKCRFSGFKVVF
jgi:hypothetical protein